MKNLSALVAVIILVLLGAVGIFLFQSKSSERYTSEKLGISFEYPQTYHVTERETGNGERARTVIELTEDTEENRKLREGKSEVPREGPVAITITAYQNNLDSYTADSWIRGTNDSNFKLSDGALSTTSVGGETALRYRWSGLYEADNVVVARPLYVFSFVVTYLAPEDTIRSDFEQILESVSFDKRTVSPPNPQATGTPEGDNGTGAATTTIPAAGKVRAALANRLSIPLSEIVILGVLERSWEDGCLGLAEEGEFCTQALVPGYEVRLWAKGREYRYRTNKGGTVLRAES